MTEKTLFQKIMDGELDGEILYEDDKCAVLRDINPQAPTHVLIVPRKVIPSLDDLTEEDEALIGHLFVVAKKIAADEGLANGYRTVFNNGRGAHQEVDHIHLHLLGGRALGWPPG
jgi:histidine triad (HIT) family protein